ncbi:hypothetical protein Vretimale_10939 [Volvox reticuliferus]|uniref:Reverse transcriptase domain-containing protein n=1 Tax=Volvox reticuliferus TaxID=1737510 RepID=A0A8J4LRJ3_9CHLO|nr:hypothetical protein Vretimale_10939 [Volvox reticuliferus]
MGIQNSWMIKVDLADAFYNILIRPEDSRFFKIVRNVVRFWRDPIVAVGGKKCQVAPPISPHQVFPTCSSRRPARLGAWVLLYLDDFLFIFFSKEQADLGARWVRETIEVLGLSCHPTKCQWEPSQGVYHLGITVNTASGLFEVHKEKLSKLRRLAVGLGVMAKKNRRLVQKCQLLRVLSWLSPQPLFFHNFYDDIMQPVGWSGCIHSSVTWFPSGS